MKYKKMLLFGIGIAVILGFFYYLGLPEILSVVAGSDFRFILLSFLMELIVLILMSIKLGEVTRGQGKLKLEKGKWSAGKYSEIGFWQFFRANSLGLLMSCFTPIPRIGGEPGKIIVLKHNGLSTSSSTVVIAIDAVTEIVSYYIIVMASIAFIVFSGILPFSVMVPFLTILVISSLIMVIFFIMCFNYSVLSKVVNFIKWIVARIPSKFSKVRYSSEDYAWNFYETFKLVMTSKIFLARIFALSFIIRFFEFFRMYFLFKAFGFEIAFSTIIFAWSIMLLMSMIPVTPGGLGLIEAGGVYAYLLFGVTKPVAGAVMVLDRLFSFWFVLFLGAFVVSPIDARETIPSLSLIKQKFRLWFMYARKKIRLKRYE